MAHYGGSGGYGAGYDSHYYTSDPSGSGSRHYDRDETGRGNTSRGRGSYGSGSNASAMNHSQRRWNNNEGVGVTREDKRSTSPTARSTRRHSQQAGLVADGTDRSEPMDIDRSSSEQGASSAPHIVANPMRNIFAAQDHFTDTLDDYLVKFKEEAEKQVAAERLQRLAKSSEHEERAKVAMEAAAESAKCKTAAKERLKAALEAINDLVQDAAIQEAANKSKYFFTNLQNTINQVNTSVKEKIEKVARENAQAVNPMRRDWERSLASLKDELAQANDRTSKTEQENAELKERVVELAARVDAAPSVRHSDNTRSTSVQAGPSNVVRAPTEADATVKEKRALPTRREMVDHLSKHDIELQEMKDQFDTRLREMTAEMTDTMQSAIDERVETYRQRMRERRASLEVDNRQGREHRDTATSAAPEPMQVESAPRDTRTIGTQSETIAVAPPPPVHTQPAGAPHTLEASQAAQTSVASIGAAVGLLPAAQPVSAAPATSPTGAIGQQPLDQLVMLIERRIEPRIRQSIQTSLRTEAQQFREVLVREVNGHMHELVERQQEVRATLEQVQRSAQDILALRQADGLQQAVLENHTVAIRRLDHHISNISSLFSKIPEAVLPPSQQQVQRQTHKNGNGTGR